jgi:hypothetical protein
MANQRFAVLLLFLPALGSAQSDRDAPEGDRKAVRVVRTATPPLLDGVLDEAEWRGAGFVDDLEQVLPVEHAEPSERTEVYLLYDDDALYVGVRVYDTEPELITANIMRQNSWIVPDDSFYVTLDPFNAGRAGFFFGTNPHGVRYDGTYRNVSEIYDNWDGIWDVAAGFFDEGWIAEFAIPFKTLSFDPNTDTWGLNFSRSVQRKNERIAWSSRNRSWDPSASGIAVGFEGIEQGVGLDIVPSVTYGNMRSFSPSGSESDFEPSIDIFYKVTPSLNASLTINTDFSATEVDDRQVNLTRFSLFFPEKRDFFLREEDIFDFGRIGARNGNGAISAAERENGRPFFSRRIGLSLQGQAVDLEYGGKLSGRLGRWEIGALSIRQDELAGVDPATLSVVRIKANLVGESTLGLMLTSGNPTSNEDNSLAGFDYVYRNSRLSGGRTVEAFGWYQQSDTEGRESDDSAMGLGFTIPSSRGFRGGFAAKEFQRNFNPGLGFLSRTDVRDYSGHVAYTHRPSAGYWQSIYSGIEGQRIESIGGELQSELLRLTFATLTNQTGDSITLRSNLQREVLDTAFEISPGIEIPAGGYSFDTFGAEFGTSRFRKVSGSVAAYSGDFYDGSRDQVSFGLRWQPSPKVATSIGYNVNYIELEAGHFETRLTTAGFDLVFSSTVSWVNLLQYDNVSDTMGLSSRLHWIPDAGRELYFVVNHTVEDFDLDDRFESLHSDAVIKVNYTLRF